MDLFEWEPAATELCNGAGPVVVCLTPAEMLQAAIAGCMRVVENCKRGRSDQYGEKVETNWQRHIEGALGECALAKHLGIYWPGKGEIFGADLGRTIECRTSPNEATRLILHPRDSDTARFYLLTGIQGRYTVRGWITGAEGKRQEYWSDFYGKNRPAYFVPREVLYHP